MLLSTSPQVCWVARPAQERAMLFYLPPALPVVMKLTALDGTWSRNGMEAIGSTWT
jgi:hypothetical protein